MADSNEKKVLIDVEIGDSESIKKLADLRKYSQDLKDAQKELDTSTEEGRQKFEQYTLEIQKNNAEIRALQTEIQKTEKANKAEVGSLEQLRTQLSLANVQYAQMSKERRKSAEGQELQKSILETTNLLKEEEKAIGNTYRNVGNYQEVINSMIPGFDKINGFLGQIGSSISDLASKGGAGFASLGKSAISMGKAFITPPIGIIVAVLSAIMFVITKVKEAFGKNEEATLRMQKAFALLQPIITFIGKLFDELAIGISKVVEYMAGAIQGVARLAEYLGLLPKGYGDAAVAAQKLVQSQKDLDDAENNYTVNSAKRDLDVAKLKDKALQKDKYSAEQRKGFLKDAMDLEKQNLDDQKNIAAQKEYDSEVQILLAEQKKFQNEQLKLSEQHQDEMRKNLLSVLNHGVDQQIRDVEDKYTELVKSLGEIKLPEFTPGMDKAKFEKDYAEAEALILNNAYKQVELKKWLENEKSKIEKQRVEAAAKDIEQIINDQYAGDLAKYTDNEKEKLRIEIESLQKIIDEKKKAWLQTYEDEAELRGLLTKQNQLQLNLELGQKQLNAKQRYDLTKSMLEQEQLLYEGNASKQFEIAQQIADNERQLLEDRTKSFEDWSSATMDAMSALNDFVSNLESAQMQEYEDNNNKKKDTLKERLDNGYITQKEYDSKTKELDKELEKQKAEIARKQAIREKAMSAFQIGINTAMGIMKTIGTMGMPAAIPMVILTAVMGAIQLAAVLAKPIPKAAKGKIISGPSHAAGGTLIEAEGGEAIINKRSTSMFAPLLSAINEAGGGVPFARPYADGGYVARNSAAAYQSRVLTIEDIKAAMTDAVSQIKVYTTIEDIRRGDRNYSQIEDRASY